MTKKFTLKSSALTFCFIVCSSCFAEANGNVAKVMALAPQDNRAVIQTAEGKMQVLSPGDKLDNATVMQVLTDKLVLRSAQGEMVWLFKSKDQQPSEMKTFSTSWPKEEWPKEMTAN